MRISFNTSYTNSINFAKNTKDYDLGYKHGKQDGLIGKYLHLQEKNLFIDKEEYGDGYNKGYMRGKRRRVPDILTKTDILQYFVVRGMPRNKAKEIMARVSNKQDKNNL